MRQCACCGQMAPGFTSWLGLDANRMPRWICGECLDFLWHKRNPEARATWKAGKAERKEKARQERDPNA